MLVRAMLAVVAALLAGVSLADPAGPLAAVPASRQASNVAIITIRGPIDDTAFKSVQRRLRLAERAGADALVIELDTPGGEVGAVLKICDAIKSSPIKNTVAWVNRDAYSGGAIIALACREIVTNDPATLGDAIPVLGQPFSIFGKVNALPESERQKILSPLMAELVSSARMFGRDEMLVQGIVSRGVELWLVENAQTGEQWTINASEYEALFGEKPVRGSPMLASAPGSVSANAAGGDPTAGQGSASGAAPGGVKAPNERRSRRARPPTMAPPPGVVEDANPYLPASPALAGLKGDMANRPIRTASARPLFTSGEKGKWTLVEYVSSGDGPFVFKADQLLRYELATETVRNDEELRAFFGGKHLLRLERSWSEGLVGFLTMLPVRGLLLVLFLLGLFIEMTHPGTVAPGAVALFALVGLIAPPLLIDLANWWEVAAILGGIVLVLLEIFVIPGFGVPGVLGVVLIMGGLIGTFMPQGSYFPGTPAGEQRLTYGAVTILLSMATAGALMYVVARHFGSIPMLNKLVLKDAGPVGDETGGDELLRAMDSGAGRVKVGAVGKAITPLHPAGRVDVDGQVLDVVADSGYISSGTRVKVTSVGEFRITVDRV